MKTIKKLSYRDLDYNTVLEYADKLSLNTDSEQNYKEVAIQLFNDKLCSEYKRAIKLRK